MGRRKTMVLTAVDDEDDEAWLRTQSDAPSAAKNKYKTAEGDRGGAKMLRKEGKPSNRVENDGVTILEEYFHPASKSTPKRKKRSASAVLSPSDSIFNESFDKLTKLEKPEGVVVVRKKDERQKLKGHECKCCEKYYDALNLEPEERKRRVNAVSRHRSTYKPFARAKSPEHFWDVQMPNTQEIYERGYIKRVNKGEQETKRKLFDLCTQGKISE